MSSIVCRLLLSCSRWFPPSLLYHLAIFLHGRPLDLFPLLGCHSVQRLVHLLSFILAICPTHLHFCFSVYSVMSIIFVLFADFRASYLVALDPPFSSPLLFERLSVSGVLTVFAHHRFANQSDGGRIIPSSLFARLANQYFGINEQSVTNKSFRNTRLSGRLHYEP